MSAKRGLNTTPREESPHKPPTDEYLNNVTALERYFILNPLYTEHEFNRLSNWSGFWLFINTNWFLCGWCYLSSCSHCWSICWSEIRKELFTFSKVWNKRWTSLRLAESPSIERTRETNCTRSKLCGQSAEDGATQQRWLRAVHEQTEKRPVFIV